MLEKLVVGLLVGVLNWWVARTDIKKGERQRLLLESLGLENAALGWLAEARLDPARWARLRVLPGASTLEFFNSVAAPESGTPPRDVSTTRRAGGRLRRDPDG